MTAYVNICRANKEKCSEFSVAMQCFCVELTVHMNLRYHMFRRRVFSVVQ